jgi:hypothetical protein
MAWDSTRPVPWQRLVRDWSIYVGLMSIVFVVLYRDELSAGPFIGLLISGPLFVAFGAVLAKFGYQRKSFRQLRSESAEQQRTAAATSHDATVRSRPAPTKRTSTGPSQAKRGTGKRR